MNLTKPKKQTLLILAIVLVVFLVLAFAIPFAKTGVFWLSLVFTVIAIAAQVYILKMAFDKGEEVRSKFYGFPIARIGLIYLVVQIVVGFIFMALASVCPPWICIIVFVLILAAAAIGLISADAMRDEVERQDEQLKTDVSAMRTLQSLSSGLPALCADAGAKAELEKLAESFRFSDPVSKPALAESEAELAGMLSELQTAVVDGDAAAVTDLCRRVSARLAERNRLCKLNK